MGLATTNAATRWAIPIALGLYACLGALLIAQKPGLQYDEALLVEGTVQLRHSTAEIALPHQPNTWVCKFHHCFPLMGEGVYIGAVKDYLCMPLFALFGPGAEVARLASMLLAMVGIWGVARLIAQRVDPGAGAAVALILAVNPAYLNMTVFDNGVVAPMMAGLGLICAALAQYLSLRSILTAFGVGAAAGFAVWARANFVWTLIAVALAALLVFRRRLRLTPSHWLALAAGGVVGGLPLLYFERVSRGATLRTMGDYTVTTSLAKMLPLRLFWLADTLLSDGEHRVMWAASQPTMTQLPQWQLWLFPLVVLAASAICLLTALWPSKTNRGVHDEDAGEDNSGDRDRAAQFAALSLTLAAAFLFSTHLLIAEHHLVALLPLAVITVVLAGLTLQHRFRWGWTISAALAVIYFVSAGYWQFASVQGLRRTGGTGVWSDGATDLARYLDRQFPGRKIKILDWGFQSSLFVLTDGRLNSEEEFSDAAPERSPEGRLWSDEIEDGGVFLLTGPHDRTYAPTVESFLQAWAAAQPETRAHRFAQRDGSTYAEVLEIEPHSTHSPGLSGPLRRALSMDDPGLEQFSTGLYELQPGGWRWTKPEFSLTLDGPDLPDAPATLSVNVFVPPQVIDKLGPITLDASIGGHAVQPETYSQQGQYTFLRKVPGDWLQHGANRFDFHVDKHLGPGPDYPRELGIVATGASLETQ